MANKKSTKRALLMSALSLLLCVSMLIGTTFAWFTDEVKSTGNVIQSGKLDAEMWWKNPGADDWTDASTGAIYNYQYWEPGYTDVKYIKLVNAGNLAFNYQLNVVPNETTDDALKLAEVIDVYCSIVTDVNADLTRTGVEGMTKLGTLLELMTNPGGADTGILLPTEGNKQHIDPETITGEYYTGEVIVCLGLKMQESANNDYQNLSVGNGFTVQLLATQYTYENDSFGPDYDDGAYILPVVYTAEELASALENGGEIIVSGTIDADTYGTIWDSANDTVEFVVDTKNGVTSLSGGEFVFDTGAKWGMVVEAYDSNITLSDMNFGGSVSWPLLLEAGEGKTITVNDIEVNATKNAGIYANEPGAVIINNAKVNHELLDASDIASTPWGPTAIAASYGVDLTINGGEYAGKNYGVFAYNSGATITINDGTFKAPVVLKADGDYSNGEIKGVIVVNGGDFDGAIELNNGFAELTINGGNFKNFSVRTWNPVIIKGGTFDVDPSEWVAEGYVAIDDGNGIYTVLPEVEGATLSYVSNGLYKDTEGNFYAFNAEGLSSLNTLLATKASGFKDVKSINLMADIDFADYTWTTIWYHQDQGYKFTTINGNGHTLKNLKTSGQAMFSLLTMPSTVTVKDLTIENAVVAGGYHVGVIVGQAAGDVTFNNVHIIGANVSGTCNVGGILGATGEFKNEVTVKFIDCSVENSTITSNGTNSDPTGASAFIGRALNKTYLVFEGNNAAQGNTISNTTGLAGGGIYGYAAYAGGFVGTGVSDTFDNWNGIELVKEGTSLQDAINTGASEVVLPAGSYALPGVSNKDVTIAGTKDTVITVNKPAYHGSSVTFDGVTVNGSGEHTGIQHVDTVTYNGVTINGAMHLYGNKVVFNDCTINLSKGQYICTYGALEAEFNNCVFNTDGKALLVYKDGGLIDTKVTVKGCTFNATAGDIAGAITNQNCAAIEIHNYESNITLITEGNTVDSDFSGEWRIKQYDLTNNCTIAVNGVTYTQTALDGRLMTVTDKFASFD